MNTNVKSFGLFLCLWVACNLAPASPHGTAFTYQCRLTDGVTNASGIYSLRFSLFDAAALGNQIGAAVTITNAPVVDGYFTASLDFGSGVFAGEARWLAIEVATNGGAFTLLTPRQSINPTPVAFYAVASGGVATPISSAQIATNQVVKSLNGLKDAISLIEGANVTVTANSNANTLTISSGVFPNNLAEYSTPGLYSITNSTSTRMVVELWGAGGGGGGGGGSGHCSGTFYSGGSGGTGAAGGYCRAIVTLTPSAIYKIRVGTGGSGGSGGFTNPNAPGVPGQPGQSGQDTTVEDSIGTVLFRSTGGQNGGGGSGGFCGGFPFPVNGTNGSPGFGDLNAPVRRTGYATGSIIPTGVIGGAGSGAGLSPSAGTSGGNGYALIQW